jgi:hypothetical protein
MSQVLTIDNRDYIPAGKVGKHFGYTRDYILALARDGKIDGRKVGHRWYVNLESAEKFFAQAKIVREERRQVVSEVRRAELKTFTTKQKTHTRASRSLEVLAIMLIGLVIGLTGYIGSGTMEKQLALTYTSDAPFLEKLAVSLYNFISPESKQTSVAVTEKQETHSMFESSPTTSQEMNTGGMPMKTVHTSLVIGPDEVLTTTSIEAIRDSFSDDVSVSIDPHNPDTGIIIPHFKDGNGESYRYLIVPVSEDANQ